MTAPSLATLTARARAEAFCTRFGLRLPILMAPMAGASPASLAIAVAQGGGLGACGALLMKPAAIRAWAQEVRAGSNGAFQLNTWVPDPAPVRDAAHEAKVRGFLAQWGPEVAAEAGDVVPVDFQAQCEAMLAAGPAIISSIMGLYPPAFVARMKAQGVSWLANVTTVAEARAAVEAGADVVIAQGMEAGGHRGTFEGDKAEATLIGLFALLPAVVDAVGDRVPVVATGGIADARGVAAALVLGASAVQIGTGLLRTPEAKLAPAWSAAIGAANPEDTVSTRAFSGRLGRSIATAYVKAANSAEAPRPAPYPVQRGLTQAMREAAGKAGDIDRMQAWAGQASRLASTEPAAAYVQRLWAEAQALLGPA
ncbi:MAG: nitronate monooxygenase family protein [Hyphomicrobiaceae bacterium]|nr:nitronate monooxygenase family protein [Hyphomicrobiaceae bacterium]